GGNREAGPQACRQVPAADVLLRGRADRVRAVPADQGPRARMRGGGTVADPEEAGRSSEDQPARRAQPGQAVARGGPARGRGSPYPPSRVPGSCVGGGGGAPRPQVQAQPTSSPAV